LAADVYRNTQNPADGMKPGKASIELMLSAFRSFSPVNGLPPNIDPFYRHFGNKSAFGEGQLYPENKYNAHKPDSEKYSSSMKGSKWQEWASFVNESTGGNQFKEGLVSLPPSVWRNYVKAFVGGPASFAAGSYDSYAEDDVTKAPFVRKVFGEVTAKNDQSKFYSISEEAIKAEKAFKDARRSNPEIAKDILEADKVLIQIGRRAEVVQEKLGEIYKNDSKVKDSKTMSDTEKKFRLRTNEQRRSDLEEKFLKEWRDALSKK
jgi:ABC-type antimicrobial peptide transport system permease subunit